MNEGKDFFLRISNSIRVRIDAVVPLIIQFFSTEPNQIQLGRNKSWPTFEQFFQDASLSPSAKFRFCLRFANENIAQLGLNLWGGKGQGGQTLDSSLRSWMVVINDTPRRQKENKAR